MKQVVSSMTLENMLSDLQFKNIIVMKMMFYIYSIYVLLSTCLKNDFTRHAVRKLWKTLMSQFLWVLSSLRKKNNEILSHSGPFNKSLKIERFACCYGCNNCCFYVMIVDLLLLLVWRWECYFLLWNWKTLHVGLVLRLTLLATLLGIFQMSTTVMTEQSENLSGMAVLCV